MMNDGVGKICNLPERRKKQTEMKKKETNTAKKEKNNNKL